MVFDKMGIIIEGVLKVMDIVLIVNYSENEILFLVVSIELGFEYLLVMVIVELVNDRDIDVYLVIDFLFILGKGVEVRFKDK